MSKLLLQKIDRDRSLVRSREQKVVEQLCEITLAEGQPFFDVEWCEGLGKKTIRYAFEAGKPVVWPLNRTIAYFGPFNLFEVYERTTEEQKINDLRDIIAKESARYADRYGYPCEEKTNKILGPHRSPDVSIVIVDSEGNRSKPYRLYELYGFGEFDDVKFDKKPSEEELEAHYQQRLRESDVALEATRRELAELRGMVLGRAQAIAQEAAAPKPRKRNPHPADCRCAAHRNKRAAETVAAGA